MSGSAVTREEIERRFAITRGHHADRDEDDAVRCDRLTASFLDAALAAFEVGDAAGRHLRETVDHLTKGLAWAIASPAGKP